MCGIVKSILSSVAVVKADYNTHNRCQQEICKQISNLFLHKNETIFTEVWVYESKMYSTIACILHIQ